MKYEIRARLGGKTYAAVQQYKAIKADGRPCKIMVASEDERTRLIHVHQVAREDVLVSSSAPDKLRRIPSQDIIIDNADWVLRKFCEPHRLVMATFTGYLGVDSEYLRYIPDLAQLSPEEYRKKIEGNWDHIPDEEDDDDRNKST